MIQFNFSRHFVTTSFLCVAFISCKTRHSNENFGIKVNQPTNPNNSVDPSKLSDIDLSQLPEEYQTWTAAKKSSYIWDKTLATRYQTLPELLPLKPVAALTADPSVTMNRRADTMPGEILNPNKVRNRTIHTQGSLAKVKFNAKLPGSAKYTGMFTEGSDFGIIRFSLVGKVEDQVKGITPGIGLKFFADEAPSPSLVAMFTLNGQGNDSNFFRNDFYTFVPDPKDAALNLIDKRFISATDNRTGKTIGSPIILSTGKPMAHARIVSAEPFTEINQKGQAVARRKTPRILKFVPNEILRNTWGASDTSDIRSRINDAGFISKGTLLYKVYGCDEYVEVRENCKEYVYMGDLVADSPAVSSKFGDVSVFFNHRAYHDGDFDKYDAKKTPE